MSYRRKLRFWDLEGAYAVSSLPKCLLLLVGIATPNLALAQQPAGAGQPSFSITIRMPPAVKAESEMLLEIAMTNTSNKDIGYGVIAGWPMWLMFQLDVSDAAGRSVPETLVGKRIRSGPQAASAVGLSLAPGKVLRSQLILNRIFDLGQTGEYKIQVRRVDQATGLEVKSNVLAFRLPSPALSSHPSTPAISITITSPFEVVKAGWQIPIEVSVKNLSSQEINLALWSGQNRDFTSEEPDEFGFGWNVRDDHGNPVPLTKQGQAFLSGEELPNGYFSFVPISPGEMVEQTRVVGSIYDVGSAGKHFIQVVLTDPTTNLPVKSNTVSVAVGSPVKLNPPFIITISPEESFTTDRRLGLRICQTNISAHAIKVDNATFDQEISLRDNDGLPVPFNEKVKKRIAAAQGSFQSGERGTDASHLWTLGPRENLCGVITLDAFDGNDTKWDLRKPGKYSIQIVRFDYPDKTPGQKMDELPLVKSNTITWTLPPESLTVPHWP
jgi:hypothetical protein